MAQIEQNWNDYFLNTACGMFVLKYFSLNVFKNIDHGYCLLVLLKKKQKHIQVLVGT